MPGECVVIQLENRCGAKKSKVLKPNSKFMGLFLSNASLVLLHLFQVISCHWTQFLAPDHNVMLLLGIIYSMIGIVGTLGNGFIILIWLRYHIKKVIFVVPKPPRPVLFHKVSHALF